MLKLRKMNTQKLLMSKGGLAANHKNKMIKRKWFYTIAYFTFLSLIILVNNSFADNAPIMNDSLVFSYGPGSNYGSYQFIGVHFDGGGGVAESYVTMDFTALPPDSPISLATLRLYVSSINASGSMAIHRILTPWDESTITYVSKPTIEVTPIAVINLTSNDLNEYISVDLTSLVSSWIDNSIPNYGIALIPLDVMTVIFDSKENQDTAHGAEIEVVPGTPPGLIPSGGIIMWSGQVSTIPEGWFLCDGNNGTPDLTDRFVIHADADSGGINNVGDTGGEHEHVLTIAEMPSHSHDVEHLDGYGAGHDMITGRNLYGPHYWQSTSAVGGNMPHENRPKYYALAFIMKN